MKLLHAGPVTDSIYKDLSARVVAFRSRSGRAPKLVVVLVGDDPASAIYTAKKAEMATRLGILSETLRFPASVDAATVRSSLQRLNQDATVDGILIQRPLPNSFKESELVTWIAPEKDVDAFHPTNVGKLQLGLPCLKPCTPWGVMRLLQHYKVKVQGMRAVVVGRSAIVGKPMAALLLQADATVFQAHRKTKRLPEITRQADLVVAAAGQPQLIRAHHLKKGVVVIDVGIHRVTSRSGRGKNAKTKIVGDVAPSATARKAKAATPVPGGVGPMTIAILMENTVHAAEGTYR